MTNATSEQRDIQVEDIVHHECRTALPAQAYLRHYVAISYQTRYALFNQPTTLQGTRSKYP